MTRTIRREPQFYQLSHFAEWARREDAESRATDLIGYMRSTHLFRSRSAPLHHEFTLVCYGRPGIADSWVRVERSARHKAHALIPQLDSFGPIFGGVELRESVSFSSQMSDLNENADELCSVTTLAAVDFTDHMLISEFAAQLAETSSADPLYRLFTANCRWFARRSILSIAQRLTTIRAVDSIYWKGQSVDAEELGARLLNDRFGGRQLAGTRGIEIRASGFINLSRTSLIAHRYSSAIEQGHKALKLLETIEAPNKVQLDLIYNACWYLGGAYNARDAYFEAFRYLQRARDIAGQIGRRTLLMDETYAANLQNIGRSEDALAVRKNIIDMLRGEEPDRHPFTLEIFCNTLIPYASHLLTVGQILEALNIIEEGVSMRRRLVEYRPDLHRRSLGQALSVLGGVYLKLDRIEEAYNVSLEALQVTREVFNIYPEATRHNMALRLHNYSIACLRSRRLEDSLHAAEEGAELWSLLYEQDPMFHLDDYSYSLHHLANSLYLADRHSEAVSKLQKWLQYETKLFETDRPRYRARFAELRHGAAQILFFVGRGEAISAGEDVVAHTRILAEQNPQVYKLVLAERMVSLALCALVVHSQEGPFATAAFRFGYEAVKEASISLADLGPESHGESLGEAFSLLARYHAYANEPLLAISAASKSYNILIKTMPLVNDEKAKKVEEALSSWTLATDLLYSTNAQEGLPYALEYLAAYRALSTSHPTIFREECFSERLWTHAVWMADKLHIKEGINELFQEAIDMARRLCARYAPPIDELYNGALMHALYAYGTYLAADHQFAHASTVVDILGEALNIARELNARDATKCSQTFVRIAVAYSNALDDVNRGTDALKASTEAVSHARSLQSPGQRDVLAETLHLHCALLHKSGQSQGAYQLCLEYLIISRGLFSRDPEKYRTGLASGLNNLSGFLHSLGREEEAIDAGIEALDHFRVIRRHDESSIQPAFGVLMRTLAHAVDEDPGTLRSRKAAVVLAQVYYELDSDAMGPNLLDRLLRYAIKLAEHGKVEDAIDTGKEALGHARTMFHQDESKYRGHLANILDNLATDTLNEGNPVACLPYAEECVVHYRILYKEQPAEYWQSLPHSLYVHASALVALHRLEEALLVCDEGILFARDALATEQSMEARRALAEALVGKSKLCAEQDRSDEEHELLEEAVDLWQSISASPDDLPNIAQVAGRHAARMWHTGQKGGGWIFARSALDLERQLFALDPDTHRARFAEALLQHAGFSEQIDLQDVTLCVSQEAIALSRVLYQQDPSSFRELLASRLCQHATFCAKLGNETEAADLVGEALPLLRELVASDRDTHLVQLVDALRDHFLRSWRTGRVSNAVPSLAEYIIGLHELELKEPGKYRDAIENGVEIFKAALESDRDQFRHYADAEVLQDSPPGISIDSDKSPQ